MRHTHEYFEKAAALPNVLQVFIKPDTEKEIKEWATKLSANDTLKYPIYQDSNAMLANHYNVPDGYAFHGQVVHYPALILLNEKGMEVFRYIGRTTATVTHSKNLLPKFKNLLKQINNPQSKSVLPIVVLNAGSDQQYIVISFGLGGKKPFEHH